MLIKVTPQNLRVYWDDAEKPTLEVPTARVGDQLRFNLSNAPWLQSRPHILQAPLDFDPHGSIGLCAWQGAASFQSVRVGPLGLTD